MKSHMNSFHMTDIIYIVFIILTLCNIRCIESSGFGACANYPSMPKFNMTKFLGKWYEIERSSFLSEPTSSCSEMSFNRNKLADGLIDSIQISISTVNRWTGSPSVNMGFATPSAENSSILNFKPFTRLPQVLAELLPSAGKYHVLFTDYESFAIFWSCRSYANLLHTDQIWLMGRTRDDFPIEIRTKIHDSLYKLGLDPTRLVLSKNERCPETFS